MKHYVYLAGPMTGLSYGAADTWRSLAAAMLDSTDVQTLSPLRGLEGVAKPTVGFEELPAQPQTTQKAIMERDYSDIRRSTCLVVHLLGSKHVSTGTVMELAWAYQHRIPTVVTMETKGNPHEHPMVREAATYVVPSLKEACEIARVLITGGER